MSKGEEKITLLLNQSNIPFIKEKTFSDLKNGQFRFDFYLPNYKGQQCIIEFNGEQHYQYVKKFYKTQLEWRQAQGRDMRKITYCLAHDINLYIIPFWEFEKIHTAADLFLPEYRALTKYKNYIDYEKYQNSKSMGKI